MPLRFWLDKIEDHKNVCYIGSEDDPDGVHIQPLTRSLIFLTLNVGIGEITERNADEFYARLHIIERIQGASTRLGGEEVYTTPQEVRAHIGLRTNVPTETRARWAKRMFIGPVKPDYNDVSITSDFTRIYRRATQEVTA